MQVILFGAPGAGKGTQAKLLGPTSSTSGISRQEICFATPSNGPRLSVRPRMPTCGTAQLVPDVITKQIIAGPLEKLDFDNFVLDGFPRTLPQAEWLLGLLDRQPDEHRLVVVSLEVDEEEGGPAPLCGAPPGPGYQSHLPPRLQPPPGASPHRLPRPTGGTIGPTAFDRRLHIYASQTEPLKRFFREKGYLVQIDGRGGIEAVFRRIKEAPGARTCMIHRLIGLRHGRAHSCR